MSDNKIEDISLSSKADAAFRQAIKKVIRQASQTNTPVIIWEENRIKEIPGDQIEAAMDAMQP